MSSGKPLGCIQENGKLDKGIIKKMKVTVEKNEKVANMIFASIYPLYLSRLKKRAEQKMNSTR